MSDQPMPHASTEEIAELAKEMLAEIKKSGAATVMDTYSDEHRAEAMLLLRERGLVKVKAGNKKYIVTLRSTL